MKGQRLRNYWYNIYKTGLELFGINLKALEKSTKKPLENARKLLNKAKKQYEKETETKAPTIREAYNKVVRAKQDTADYRDTPRDTETNRTETANNMYDASVETIMQFFENMKAIYNKSIDEIARTRSNTTHDDGKLGSIMYNYEDEINYYYEFMSATFEDFLSLSEPEIDEVAERLTQSQEFDYEWAVVFYYPSNIVNNFEYSAMNLKAIWDSVVVKR